MLASDQEREGVLRRLRACYADGLLGQDTLERRVGATLVAQRRGELAALVGDLPTRSTALRDAWTLLTRSGRTSASTDVVLPGWSDPATVVGRSRTCDVTLADDDTVSGRHLELRALPDRARWLAVDLGSLNGTWFLGRRIGRTILHAGDELLIGQSAIRLIAPR